MVYDEEVGWFVAFGGEDVDAERVEVGFVGIVEQGDVGWGLGRDVVYPDGAFGVGITERALGRDLVL